MKTEHANFENCEDHESRFPDVNKRSELEEYINQINTAVEV